jgi:hypothetical protein
VPRAVCTDCAWSTEDDDGVAVSDAMERHARKEQHHVEFERVVTDGGQVTDQRYEVVCHDCDFEATDIGREGRRHLETGAEVHRAAFGHRVDVQEVRD